MSEDVETTAQEDATSSSGKGVAPNGTSRRGLLKLMAISGASVAAASVLKPGTIDAASARVVHSTATGVKKNADSRPSGAVAAADGGPLLIGIQNLGSNPGAQTSLFANVPPGPAVPQGSQGGFYVNNDQAGAVAIKGIAPNLAVGGGRAPIAVVGSTFYADTPLGGSPIAIGDPGVPTGVVGVGGFNYDQTLGLAPAPTRVVAIGVAGTTSVAQGGTVLTPTYPAFNASAGVVGASGDAVGVAAQTFTGPSGVVAVAANTGVGNAIGLNAFAVGTTDPGAAPAPTIFGILAGEHADTNGRAISANSLSNGGIGVSAYGDSGVVGFGNPTGVVTASNNLNVAAGVVGVVDSTIAPGPAGKKLGSVVVREGRVALPSSAAGVKAKITTSAKYTPSNMVTAFSSLPKKASDISKALPALKIQPAAVTPAIFPLPSASINQSGVVGSSNVAGTAGVFGINLDPTGYGVYGFGAQAGGVFATTGSLGSIGVDASGDIGVNATGILVGSSASGVIGSAAFGLAVGQVTVGTIGQTILADTLGLGVFTPANSTGIGVVAGSLGLGILANDPGSTGALISANGNGLIVLANETTSTGAQVTGGQSGVFATADTSGGVGVTGLATGAGSAGVVGTSDIGFGVAGFSAGAAAPAAASPLNAFDPGVYAASSGAGHFAAVLDGQNGACSLYTTSGITVNGGSTTTTPVIAGCPNVINGDTTFNNGTVVFTTPPVGVAHIGRSANQTTCPPNPAGVIAPAFAVSGPNAQSVTVVDPYVKACDYIGVTLVSKAGATGFQNNTVAAIIVSPAGGSFTIYLERPNTNPLLGYTYAVLR